jgi:hypothetical protein
MPLDKRRHLLWICVTYFAHCSAKALLNVVILVVKE